MRSARTSGLTLVELVSSLTVLTLGTLALAYASSTSIVATRSAKPRFLAEQAAQRVIEEYRAAPFASFYTASWGAPAKLTQAAVGSFPAYDYVSLDGSQTFADILAPAVGQGVLGAPATGSMLRLRLLSERDYNVGLTTSVDLDFDGSTTSTVIAGTYRLFPIVVEVHWREEAGAQTYRQFAVIQDMPELDPTRQ